MKHAALLILLLLPAVHALSTDRDVYAAGDFMTIFTNEPVRITTPSGSYTVLGTPTHIAFPTEEAGVHTIAGTQETLYIPVLPARDMLIRETRGASVIRAADAGTHATLLMPGLGTVHVHGMTSVARITPSLGPRWGFLRTYAVDPTLPDTERIEITTTAHGNALYKCAAFDYAAERCTGSWAYQHDITPGEPYTIIAQGADPVYGEGSTPGTPSSCRFWDQAGAGDGDSNANCLTEVQTQNNGQTADLDDTEGGGNSEIQINYSNTLKIKSINAINVTYRYQRATNSAVGATTATIQVWDNNAWTTACTDTVTVGSWETYTCNLGSYITGAEGNNVRTRILFSTARVARPGDEATVWVDYSYLGIDFVYNDTDAPTYSGITAQQSSPKSYDGKASNFSVTWTDDAEIDEVRIEHNFTGTWQNTTLSGTSTYTYSTVLPAGTYGWRQNANDTSNNRNDSMPYQTYIVQKATGEAELLLNGTAGNIVVDEGTTVTINATRIAGETSMTLYENGTSLGSGTSINLARTYNTPGRYGVLLELNATQNYTGTTQQWNITVRDITPPPGVTALQNISADINWIYWTWTNPGGDFSHTIIAINGTWYTNTSNSFVNVTGLNAGTTYEIQVRTVDLSGNVNHTIVSDLGRTLDSTDTTPPRIENVTNTSITDSYATIAWDTDEIANTRVKYGNASGTYTQSVFNALHVRQHSIILQDLKPSTTYYYVVNSTDPASNSNQSSEYSFTTLPDTTPPQYSSITAIPSTPATYPVQANFSVTWTDNGAVDRVLVEHNFTGTWQNDSTHITGMSYWYTISLGAGTYSWRQLANDTRNNRNDSMPYQTYVVQPATGQVSLLLNGTNGNLAINEGNTITITATQTAGEGIIEILENGTVLQSQRGTHNLTRLYPNPGTYAITARQNATQNYTAAQQEHTLTVHDTTPPEVTLLQPYPGVTKTQPDVTFTYIPDDNVLTTSCSLYINNTQNATNTTITEEGINSFSTNFTDGLYSWNVECSDAAGNRKNSTQRNFTVESIPHWIPKNAIHNADGNVTGAVNASGGTTSRLDNGEYVTVDVWSGRAPSNANITAVDAYCELTGSQRGAVLYFQYNTGSGWSGEICQGPQNGNGRFGCDLYAQGVDTVTELNDLQVRCIIRDGDGGPPAYSFLDFMEVVPDWTLIVMPDFNITSADLSFPQGAGEGTLATLNATVRNDGTADATALVRFHDDTRGQTIYETSRTIAAGNEELFQAEWTAAIGRTTITVLVDPNDIVDELNETNNNATAFIDVDAWHTYYGSTIARYWVLSDDIAHQFNWTNDALSGNIYAVDQDASVTMLNVQALTRTPQGDYRFTDLATADEHLGMTGWIDSINATYSDGGTLRGTSTFTVFGKVITDVPTVDSTTTSAFRTGILYDVDDDTNGGYDGEEDLIFITVVNRSMLGAYGTYDYELTLPALLRKDTPGADIIELYIEVT